MSRIQSSPSQSQGSEQTTAPQQQAPEEVQPQGNAAAGQQASSQTAASSPTPTLDVADEQESGGGGGGDQAQGSGGQAGGTSAGGGGGGGTPPADSGGGGGGGAAASGGGGGGGGSGTAAAQASVPPQPIEGADTKAYAEAYKAATPTEKAASYAEVGPKMDELSKGEQGELEDGIPEYHATMVDNMPLTEGGDVAVETPTASGEVDDGGTGQIEDPEIQETQDLGEFPGNQGAGDAVGGMSDESSEEQRASAISSEMSSMTTADGAVETSPGPTPPVPLEGDTDLQRTNQAVASSGTEAGEAHTDARQAVVDGPGQEQVQPIVMDEILIVAEMPDVNIDTPNAIAEMDQYTNLPTQPEVQPAFDELYAAEMEASAGEAQTQIDDAVSTRDVDSAAELTRAEAEHQQMVTDAETEQDRAVSEGRSEIDSQRQQAMTDQEAAVSDFRSSAQSEHQSRSMEAERRISADESRIRSEYDAAQTEAEGEVRSGEEEARREKERKEREAENQSWWDRAVSAISDLVSAIADAINSIFDAVREAVSAVLDAVKDLACSIIDAACSFICSLIEAFGEFLKALVTNLLGAIFPEIAAALCAAIDAAVDLAQQAVNAAADALKAGVAALCDAVNAAINAIISAYQAAVNAALAVMQAVLTGDWMAVLLMALEAALSICGISPDEFYALIGRLDATIETIVNDPGAFLSNCLDAVGQGFSQFGDNFLEHLQNGFIEWLTGTAGEAGITMPDNFDLAGIFSIVLQVMGLTYDRIREEAVDLIGEDNVAMLEFVWGFISAAIEGGLEGLWEHIQGQLDNLWDMVIGQIQEWIMTRIVMAAIQKLATMWNPFGAIVQAILTAWDLYCFLRDEIQRIFGVVQAVVNTIADIASGNIGGAANMVEQALADLVPIAISLLANLLGFGGIGAKVREIIESIQDTVWGAIRAVIDRFIGMFTGGSGASDTAETDGAESGAQPGDGEVGETVQFSDSDESHRLWINTEGNNVTVMVASTPGPVEQKLTEWEGRIGDLSADQQSDARSHLGTARQRLGITQTEAGEAAAAMTASSSGAGSSSSAGGFEEADVQAEQAERTLAQSLTVLFDLFGEANTLNHPVYESIGQKVADRKTGDDADTQIDPAATNAKRGAAGQEAYHYQLNDDVYLHIQRNPGAGDRGAPQVHIDRSGYLREGAPPANNRREAQSGADLERRRIEFEGRLGQMLSRHSVAIGTASSMLRKCVDYMRERVDALITATEDAAEKMEELFVKAATHWRHGVFSDREFAGRAENMDQLKDIVAGNGSLRENLTWTQNFASTVIGADFVGPDKLTHAQDIAREAGLNVDWIDERLAEMRASSGASSGTGGGSGNWDDRKGGWDFYAQGESPVVRMQGEMRDNDPNPEHGSAFSGRSREEFTREYDSVDAEAHGNVPDRSGELVDRPALDARESGELTPNPLEAEVGTRLVPWAEGEKVWMLRETSAFVEAARDMNIPLAAGISGTTLRLMEAGAMLGVTPPVNVRLSLLGYLLPIRAHSFHEIMSAASQAGAPYAGDCNYRRIQPLSEGEIRAACGPFPEEQDSGGGSS